jgi:adenosylcobinamide-phosphate synthase
MTRAQLAAACALDALVGDPPAWPHPVHAFGAVINAADRRRDAGAPPWRQFAEGALLTVALAGSAVLTGRFLERRAALPAIVLGAATLAARSLDDAVAAVQYALERDDLATARVKLARIVGRDVDHLDAPAIAAAALESLAESFCDGVVAPLFWLRTGGLGAALAFKAISTLDSLIGHREEPYLWFGRVAARADDVANFIPARLAVAAIVLAALTQADRRRRAYAVITTALRDAPAHRSPNGGWPEAALAGALGVRLGGAASYDGIVTSRPVLGAEFRSPVVADLAAGRALIIRAALLVSLAAVVSAR